MERRRHRAGHGHLAAASAAATVGHRGRIVLTECEGRLLRLRQVAISTRTSRPHCRPIRVPKQHPNISFTIEGHCDERGSTEYNLALGDSRANSVRNALVQGGVAADHVKTISYGKEKPFCTESNESAGSRTAAAISFTGNRRLVAPASRRLSRGRLALAPLGGSDFASQPPPCRRYITASSSGLGRGTHSSHRRY